MNIKDAALGISHGTAANRLRKSIMFALICETKRNVCHQCGAGIWKVEDLSVEHKEPWLAADDPRKAFFDLNNIAFSHLKCNVRAARPRPRKIFRSDARLKSMKKKHPSRTPAARRKEYAKSKG